jgi:hypothetical protein
MKMVWWWWCYDDGNDDLDRPTIYYTHTHVAWVQLYLHSIEMAQKTRKEQEYLPI